MTLSERQLLNHIPYGKSGASGYDHVVVLFVYGMARLISELYVD